MSGIKSCAWFDMERFKADLDELREQMGYTWRAVAGSCGVAHSTFTRVYAEGKTIDINTLARIIVWSGLDTNDYIQPSPSLQKSAWEWNNRRLKEVWCECNHWNAWLCSCCDRCECHYKEEGEGNNV